jgi:3-mercaptopyruvate sulfurtransferase SseA
MKGHGVFILDVRSDSAFRHISSDAKENALGIIKGSVNIPLADLTGRLSEIPKAGAEIVVTDLYGDDAVRAAVLLKQNKFDKVSVLIEGVERILLTDKDKITCRNELYVSPLSYTTITVSEFGKYVKENTNYILLDVRTADEFLNRHTDNWRNIGHIKDAVNIPLADLSRRAGQLDKSKEILIYSFGGAEGRVYKTDCDIWRYF